MTSRRGREGSATQALTILRSNGGKHEITIALTSTLQDLKIAISQSTALGQPAPADQRVFHMGRELKSTGRTLEKLGLCKWGIPVVHVHAKRTSTTGSLAPFKLEVADSSENDSDDVVEVLHDAPVSKRGESAAVSSSDGIIDLAGENSDEEEDDDDDELDSAPEACAKRHRVM